MKVWRVALFLYISFVIYKIYACLVNNTYVIPCPAVSFHRYIRKCVLFRVRGYMGRGLWFFMSSSCLAPRPPPTPPSACIPQRQITKRQARKVQSYLSCVNPPPLPLLTEMCLYHVMLSKRYQQTGTWPTRAPGITYGLWPYPATLPPPIPAPHVHSLASRSLFQGCIAL